MDFLTSDQRSRLMSKVRQNGTDIERSVAHQLRLRGIRFRRNVRTLAGSPDLVFTKSKLAVFIDGDFWHGYQFPRWQHKLQPFWREKIHRNRCRDKSNFRKLRRGGWKVIRLWQHQIERDCGACIARIIKAIRSTGRRE